MQKFNCRAAFMAAYTMVASAILIGCSTVSSIDLSATEEPARAGAYLNYSVAKSVFQIQIAAATSSAQAPATSAPATTSTVPAAAASPAPAPAAAPAAGGGATANATTTTTTNVTASTASQPVDATMCGVITAEYTAGQTAVAGNIANYSNLLARAAQMASGKPAPKDTPKALAIDLRTYLISVRDPAYLTTLSINNNRTYDQVVRDCAPKVTVSIQQIVVPDTAHTFALRPRTNILYADALTLGTDANGFITNGAPGSTSQVTAIASAIAGDIGTAMTPGAGAVHVFTPQLAPSLAAKSSCMTGPVAKVDDQINDLETCVDPTSARALLSQIAGDLNPPGAMMNLPASVLPVTFYVPLEVLEAKASKPTEGLLKFVKGTLNVSMTFTCSKRNPAIPGAGELPENSPANGALGNPRPAGIYDGIVVSAPRACEFTASQARTGLANGTPLAYNHFWAQDSRYLTLLPTTRGFLVQRTVGYTFANGQATGVSDSRPSEALAVVSFPGTVLGAFFSGVTTAATNNQAFNNAKTTGLNAQYSNLQAQVNVLNEQAALNIAKAAAAGPQK